MSLASRILNQSFPAAVCLVVCSGFVFAMDDKSPKPDLSGHWKGHWESCSSGHKGPLQATFCKVDETHYRVHFRGRFLKIVPFRYTVTLMVNGQQGEKVILDGESHLFLFGTFSYHAEATDKEFCATYCSRRDQGKFEMKRCEGSGRPCRER